MATIVKYFGDSCTITAVPATGYYFTEWTGDITGSTNPYTIASVEQDYDITANFDNHYTVSVDLTEGTITGSTVAITGESGTSASFEYGDSVTVVATAATGVTFGGWYDGATLVSSSASYTFTVSADTALTAHFGDTEYTITVVADPVSGGTITLV